MKTRTTRTTIIGNHICRMVHFDYGCGESWTRYIIVPRELALKWIRSRKAKGESQTDPICCAPYEFFAMERDGGPGRGFARRPGRLKSSRRFLVWYQSGGLDV